MSVKSNIVSACRQWKSMAAIGMVIMSFTMLLPAANASTSTYPRHEHISPKPKLIAFARQWLGVKYRYGASHPSKGFDCSGFVYFVFKNFHIDIPRSSSAMAQAGQTIALKSAMPGDIILFTGTDPRKRNIGHVGIVVSNDGNSTKFIHASSGKAQAVTETALEGSYKRRFVKIIRVQS